MFRKTIKDEKRKEHLEHLAIFEEQKKKLSIPPPPNQIIYEDEEVPRYRR